MKKTSSRRGRPGKYPAPLTADQRLSAGPPSVLTRLFSIDARSLAVFRMAMGALLLVDLIIRATDLAAMYTDSGMFPRQVIREHYTTVWNWSFHAAGGTPGFEAALFGLAALLALAVVAGFRTRTAVVGSWLMLLSLQNRVPPILNAGDELCRMLLFWAMFLPLGSTWSLDTWLARRRDAQIASSKAPPILSISSGAILIQMALMYLMSALFKSTPEWFRGDVIAGTLSHYFYAKPAGTWLLQFPGLLKGLTLGVFVLEWVGPLLLFSPKHTAAVRLAVITALAAMHLGIQIFLTVGLFSWVSLAGLLLFLPSAFWTRLCREVPETSAGQPAPPVIPERSAAYWTGQGICLLALFYVLVINLAGLIGKSGPASGTVGSRFLNMAIGLGQKWNMFQDTPSNNGWYVARAKLNDGSEVDLLKGGAPAELNPPGNPATIYPNHRWRKCFREMSYEDAQGFQVFRLPVSRFLCRHWNASHPPGQQIKGFELIYNLEQTSTDEKGAQVEVTVHQRLLRLDPDHF